MEESCKKECAKVKVVPVSTWQAALLRRAVGIYKTLKVREADKLAAFKQAHRGLLAKLTAANKKAADLAYAAAVTHNDADYKRAVVLADMDYKRQVVLADMEYKAAVALRDVEFKAAVTAADFKDMKSALYVEASIAGVVSGQYERRDKVEVEKGEVVKREVKKAVVKKYKVAKPKAVAFVFDPGNQVFDPRKQGDLVAFLGKSKHPEYQALLAEFEDLKLGVELADLPAALAAIRTFRNADAPLA